MIGYTLALLAATASAVHSHAKTKSMSESLNSEYEGFKDDTESLQLMQIA